MDILEIIRQIIREFCVEFMHNPYLCYTEQGQHALFYARLYNAIPDLQRYITWQGKKTCIIQKEYPTATNLGKSQRQGWDISVLHDPPESIRNGKESYDYLKLSAAIEFGLNEEKEHLRDDICRLSHMEANVVQGFIIHLYRLSEAGNQFSGRDQSPNARGICTLEDVRLLSQGNTVEIYYGMVGCTGTFGPGLWKINDGQVEQIAWEQVR